MASPLRRPVLALVLATALLAGCTSDVRRDGAAPTRRSEVAVGRQQRDDDKRQQRDDDNRRIAQPKPFRVRLVAVSARPMANSRLFARRSPAAHRHAATKAARSATAALQRYLNTTFVAKRTRGTRAALRRFTTVDARRALTPSDVRGLGMRGLRIPGGGTTRARAKAAVLMNGRRPVYVALRHRARMRVRGRHHVARLTQTGSSVLVPGRRGWRADALELRLSMRGGRTDADDRNPRRGGDRRNGAAPRPRSKRRKG